MTMKIEEKLYQNRYRVFEGEPHVCIDPTKADVEALKAMVNICPAGCYVETEDGKVEVVPDGCMECGTCRIVCQDTGALQWGYPRGGYGVLFKFG
ncbi:ferredoxin family protein [Pararhodospirillum oryzae]|uniref:Ferredoxin-like protein n=1 Tax=Pararhodospirillum oryzae TaxID=478448 RepID=A0A512H7I1_9PROT|nr:ferredoxin family protein [Pararhodospirillum oryzae]GEO81388.1 ferredoxin family protein [Pararhodospirillum oryzae]